MLLRAVICTFILLTQPLAAWAGVMQMPSMGHVDQAASMPDHCDDMPEHVRSDAHDDFGDDCDIACDNCVAAAAMIPAVIVNSASIVHAPAPAFALQVLPPGTTERLYRPPCFSWSQAGIALPDL